MKWRYSKYPTVEQALAKIPSSFTSDGLSGGFPDSWFAKWKLTEIDWPHAWEYCTRCHEAGTRTKRAQRWADRQLNSHANERLPWWLAIVPFVLLGGVRAGGHYSFDTCYRELPEDASPEQLRLNLCRHSMPRPEWMEDHP